MAERVVHEHGPWGVTVFHDVERGAHAECGYAHGFEMSCDQTHGLMADGSQRDQKGEVDSLCLEPFDDTRDNLFPRSAL